MMFRHNPVDRHISPLIPCVDLRQSPLRHPVLPAAIYNVQHQVTLWGEKKWHGGRVLDLGSRGPEFKSRQCQKWWNALFVNIYHYRVSLMLFMHSFVVSVCTDKFVALTKPSAECSSLYYRAKSCLLYVMFTSCFMFYCMYCPAWQMLYCVIIVLCSILSAS